MKYATLPRGEKGPYATSLGVPSRTIITWISALADGDLDSGIFPRKTGSMTTRDTSEVHRLRIALAEAENNNQLNIRGYENR